MQRLDEATKCKLQHWLPFSHVLCSASVLPLLLPCFAKQRRIRDGLAPTPSQPGYLQVKQKV